MITFDELNTQHNELTELTNVLLYLIANRTICETKPTNALFFQYLEKVGQHLKSVDHLYPVLLADRDQHANNAASNFMAGEHEIRKIISGYIKAWINKKKHELVIKNYEEFLTDTQMLFHLILDRIQDETDHLYPLVRRMDSEE
uniref:Hemerythrin HHE cation binding domain-containing protein n=1 Tax=Candidatus Kentrum sp. LFY TaxID=2126342 RepID=A0A450WXT1_9GAMM|nr:MAG: hypothetical protein BECKLFY1418C_GA0070996_11038 [Candidatus Kentron sp. LFY]